MPIGTTKNVELLRELSLVIKGQLRLGRKAEENQQEHLTNALSLETWANDSPHFCSLPLLPSPKKCELLVNTVWWRQNRGGRGLRHLSPPHTPTLKPDTFGISTKAGWLQGLRNPGHSLPASPQWAAPDR